VSTSLSLTETRQRVLPYFCWNTYAVISVEPHGNLQTRHTQHVGEACGKCMHKGASHSFPTVSGQIHHSLIRLEMGYASTERSSRRVQCWCDTGTGAEQNKGLVLHVHQHVHRSLGQRGLLDFRVWPPFVKRDYIQPKTVYSV